MAKQVTSINGMGSISEVGGVFTTKGMEANDHMHISEDFIKNAGVRSIVSDHFIVTEAAVPGKKVLVQEGTAYVPNSNYTDASLSEQRYWRCKMDAEEEVTINDNVSGNPRIDIICIKIDPLATPDDEATNVMTLVAIEGTPAASPTVPATPGDHYKLAEVAVANGFSSIVNANITDRRVNVSVADEAGGWISAGETWTYASADDPTFTLTISGDKTSKYSPGMRVKLNQTTDKYFIITKVAYGAPNTTLTLYGGTDYDLANATILNPSYSGMKFPQGFPDDPSKWTVEYSSSVDNDTSGTTSGVWYQYGSIQINLPIGKWTITISGLLRADYSSAANVRMQTTFSTTTNSETNEEFTTWYEEGAADTVVFDSIDLGCKPLSILTKTTYYLLGMITSGASITRNRMNGTLKKTAIRALSAYY